MPLLHLPLLQLVLITLCYCTGGDPVIAGALAMTGGFCGTLLTPMAANFNTLPVALLEMKEEFGVIKHKHQLLQY